MPKAYFMMGLPGSGKSTFITEFFSNFENRPVLISTDYYIDKWAKDAGLSYDEVFEDSVKGAERTMMVDLDKAVKYDRDIVWDQTNLTVKSRAKKLKLIPFHYEVIGILVQANDFARLSQRLTNRPSKTIPKHVIWNMMATMNYPELDEGFSKILEIRT